MNINQTIALEELVAGGPGSGRKATGQNNKVGKRALSKLYGKAQEKLAFHNNKAMLHKQIAKHYSNAADAYDSGDKKAGDHHMSLGDIASGLA